MTALLAVFLCVGRGAAALFPDEENTIQVAREAAKSVVFVTNIQVARTYSMDEFAIPAGAGSGFVWDRNGHIVTNFHVLQGADAFLVTLWDHTEFKAKLVAAEPRKDIAVLKIEAAAAKLHPVRLGNSDALQVGQKAVAIGNPFGLDSSVSRGIVSALGRQVMGAGDVTIRDMIQTDAAINPGNSGGPLLDSGGVLIGMNTVIYSRSGSSAGVGFAVPVKSIKRIVPQLIQHGKAIQPGIGVILLNDQQKYSLLGDLSGAVIRGITKGSPAARAGLRGISRDDDGGFLLGDIIIGIDEHPIENYDDLYQALDSRRVGDRVTVRYLRNNRKRSVIVELINVY